MDAIKIKNELKKYSNQEYAAHHQVFFKTLPGEYGEGDVFIGVRVPDIRKVAKKYNGIDHNVIEELLSDEVHEYRLIALIIMVNVYSLKRTDKKTREKLFNIYIKNKDRINNWDLIDISAPHIVGAWLFDKQKDLLHDLADSSILWDRRIAIISTMYFIRQNEFDHTLKIAKTLLQDKEDLIHKAVGWMLREVGKRDRDIEEIFLKKHLKKMPRTMLRYSIEKFPEKLRLSYLKG
jgi:3-methyladenine DNA glycosylase AlkD